MAYADFVTAMMALFMVLWLTSQDQRIKEAVERAFRNPFSSVTKESVGIIPSKETQAVRSSSGNFDSASAVELTMLRRLNQDLLKVPAKAACRTRKKRLRSEAFDMTPDGLSINVFDRSHKPIFESQSTIFTAYGDWVFSTLAWEIARYHNFKIELKGPHRERQRSSVREDYGDWGNFDRPRERRAPQIASSTESSIRQIRKVAGYGSTRPMPNEDATGK